MPITLKLLALFKGGSPLTSGANCGVPLVRPRFAELAICVSPCGAILHLSLSAQVVSSLPCEELECQRLFFSFSFSAQSSAPVPMDMIQEKNQKVNESENRHSSKWQLRVSMLPGYRNPLISARFWIFDRSDFGRCWEKFVWYANRFFVLLRAIIGVWKGEIRASAHGICEMTKMKVRWFP